MLRARFKCTDVILQSDKEGAEIRFIPVISDRIDDFFIKYNPWRGYQ